ncbi:MAG: hypothetical protein LBK02_01105 [Treponema sp.]|jgi:hypothetical protein|nr:hypothetical protein [Treponema sp.]
MKGIAKKLKGRKTAKNKGCRGFLKYAAGIAAMMVLLGTCDFLMGPKELSGGNVTLRLGPGNGEARAALPDAVIAGLRYKVEFRGPGETVINRNLEPGSGTLRLSLALGEWEIQAQAYTLGDVLAGTGTLAVTVVPGEAEVYIPMTAAAVRIRYVKAAGSGDGTTWENASGDLQAMIDEMGAAKTADPLIDPVVKVAAGTYKPKYKPDSSGRPVLAANDRDAAFILRPGVQVLGGYAAAEDGSTGDAERAGRFNADGTLTGDIYRATLSGDFGNNDTVSGSGKTLTITNNGENARHVVLGLDIPGDGTTILDGFTITGGNANNSGPIPMSLYYIDPYGGGGIYNSNASPVLTNLTIWGNSSGVMGGGGMYNYDYSSPRLNKVSILQNKIGGGGGGGMHNVDNSSPVLTGVTISGNFSGGMGGGMANDNSSSPEMTGGTISGNHANVGGGMSNENTSPRLDGVSIRDNTAEWGGGVFNSNSSPVLTNVIISGNKAIDDTLSYGEGGGIANIDGSAPVINGGSITENEAVEGGGGMFNYDSSPVLIGTVITKNKVIKGRNGYDNSISGGGGIYNEDSSPALINTVIAGNDAGIYGYGGGFYNTASSSSENASPVLINTVISGNRTAFLGGGICNDNSNAGTVKMLLINVTVAGNAATGWSGGAVYNEGNAALFIRNSIIWGNDDEYGMTFNNYSNNLVVSFSCIEDNTSWGIVIGVDPFEEWIDPYPTIPPSPPGAIASNPLSWTPTDGGDYRLKANSEAGDAGNNALYPNTWAKWSDSSGDIPAAMKTTAFKTAYYDPYIGPALQTDASGTTQRVKTGSSNLSTIDMGAYER